MGIDCNGLTIIPPDELKDGESYYYTVVVNEDWDTVVSRGVFDEEAGAMRVLPLSKGEKISAPAKDHLIFDCRQFFVINCSKAKSDTTLLVSVAEY